MKQIYLIIILKNFIKRHIKGVWVNCRICRMLMVMQYLYVVTVTYNIFFLEEGICIINSHLYRSITKRY